MEKMTFRRKTIGRVLMIINLALIGWLIIGSISETLYERADVHIPDYPSATNVQTTPQPYGPPGAGFQLITTFETIDSPETVLAFYRAQLTPRGLQHWDIFVAGQENAAVFRREGCPSHTLTIGPLASADGLTMIRVNHSAITRC